MEEKDLQLEIEELEQRIAPGSVNIGGVTNSSNHDQVHVNNVGNIHNNNDIDIL